MNSRRPSFLRLLLGSLLALGTAVAGENPPVPPITLREVTVDSNGRSLRISLLVFPGKDFALRVIDNAGAGGEPRFPSLVAAMETLDALAGCNGGFFERQPFSPVGLMVSRGQRSGRFDPESWMKGLLVVRRGVATLESTTSFADSPDVAELIQSGPWLVRAGQAETDNTRTQQARRTFLCHDAHGTWALGASERCTLTELAAALRSPEVALILAIEFALNLDGGPSTGLWLRRSNSNFYFPDRWPVRNYVGIFPRSAP